MSETRHEPDPEQGEIIHEYDGILEADNELPRWWLGIFFTMIAFAFGYWFVYESWEIAATPSAAYEQELARAAEQRGAEVDDGTLEQLAQSDTVVERGRAAYETNCVVCHGSRAEGNIGPNLTDASWLHGGAPSEVYRTVHDGYTPRGMPAWGAVLGASEVQALTAFLLTVRDTNVPGRAPEGVVIGSEPEPAEEPPTEEGAAAEAEPGEPLAGALEPEP